MMKKIDEGQYNNIFIKFYDGIDIKYALEYKGDDMLIFFVNIWEDEVRLHKRESIINGILYNNDIDINTDINNMITIYETRGYLMETFITVRNNLKREYSGTWNIIAKK